MQVEPSTSTFSTPAWRAASITLASCRGTASLSVPLVAGSPNSGTSSLEITSAAGAFIIGKTLGDSGGGQQLSFFGISILIAVGVALETVKQIDGQLMMRNYEGFLDNSKSKARAKSKAKATTK